MEDLQKQALIRIVDDDESLLFSTQIYLEALGWKVVTYNNAVDFLNRDNLNLPGCLILDVRMPRMTGLELQELLESRGFAHFPIIFLSGHGDIEMAVHTMSHGAVTFLEKPADPERKRGKRTKRSPQKIQLSYPSGSRSNQACKQRSF